MSKYVAQMTPRFGYAIQVIDVVSNKVVAYCEDVDDGVMIKDALNEQEKRNGK